LSGGRWSVSSYFILSKLMEVLKGRYQISGPSAFNFHGFDDQVPNRIYVYNDRIFGEKQIGGTDFVFIKTSTKRLGSTKNLKTPDGMDAVMVTKTRALVDAVNKARPTGTKGIYLKKVAVSSTMGPGVRVDQSSFAQQQQ